MAQLIDPPTRTHPPAELPRLRWNREQYESLFAAGIVPQRGFELIQGDIIPKMPTKEAHSYVITLLFALFSRLCGFPVLRSQFTLAVDDENLPEPDFAVLTTPQPTRTSRGYLRVQEIRLIIEVSDATLAGDLTTKAILYASAGVSEYWVVDVMGRRLLVHTLPSKEGYTQVTQYTESDAVSPALAPQETFLVQDILPELS
jgi:Uma2 family endonuclease